MKKKILLLIGLASISLICKTMGQNVPAFMPSNGLQGWWPFNGNANDESVNSNNGIVNGATLTTDRNGNANSAYSFDGISNSITIPDSDSLSFANNVFTISFWLNWDTNSTQELAIMGKRGSLTSNFEYYIGKISPSATSPNRIMPHTWNLGGTNVYQFPNPQPNTSTAGIWEHFVITADSIECKVYKNGIYLFSSLTPTLNMGNSTGNLTIGAGGGWASTNYMDGMLDDIGIWNRALSDCEIAEMFFETNVIIAQPHDTTGIVSGSTYFSFTGATGATYQWQGNFGNGFNDLSNDVQYSGVTTNTLNVSNLSITDNDKIYRCIVTLGSCATITDTVVLSVTDESSIVKILAETSFSIKPNPAQSNTTLIVTEKLLNMPYAIINSVGQNVIQGKITNKSTDIDLTALSEGIYTIQIAGAIAKKMVVRK